MDFFSKYLFLAFAEYVVKAQILAGGRGRGSFIGSQAKRGGVRITKELTISLHFLN